MNKEQSLKAIVIPVYKDSMNQYEEISLQQCISVLGEYPLILVCPTGLCTKAYEDIASKNNVSFTIERFPTHFFEGLVAYNRLMLDKSFYSRFVDYEYILIYQLDCFIFKNEFDFWCDKGYDYIGAPWILNFKRKGASLLIRKVILKLRRLAKYVLKKQNGYDTVEYQVGNGGLSLRKPHKFIEIITKFEENKRINRYRNPTDNNPSGSFYWEDVFWGCEVNAISHNLKIPKYKTALKFSFEYDPKYCLEMNNARLPFGCHAWARADLNFWKPYIEKFGYNIEIKQ